MSSAVYAATKAGVNQLTRPPTPPLPSRQLRGLLRARRVGAAQFAAKGLLRDSSAALERLPRHRGEAFSFITLRCGRPLARFICRSGLVTRSGVKPGGSNEASDEAQWGLGFRAQWRSESKAFIALRQMRLVTRPNGVKNSG